MAFFLNFCENICENILTKINGIIKSMEYGYEPLDKKEIF
jgi:hypothetical protein